jgi:hypothetical protein
MNELTLFERTHEILLNNGYYLMTQVVTAADNYLYCSVEGKGIVGGFCSKNNNDHLQCNQYLNGKIAIDNVRCYDKPRKCPLILDLPKNKQEESFLLKQLEFWGSDEGFNISNQCQFNKYINKYPPSLEGEIDDLNDEELNELLNILGIEITCTDYSSQKI